MAISSLVTAPSIFKSFTDDPALPGGTVTLEFTLDLPEGPYLQVRGEDVDIFGVHVAGGNVAVMILVMRGGQVLDRRELFWEGQGIKRVNMARELSLEEIEGLALDISHQCLDHLVGLGQAEIDQNLHFINPEDSILTTDGEWTTSSNWSLGTPTGTTNAYIVGDALGERPSGILHQVPIVGADVD